jgi:hypothetical protein
MTFVLKIEFIINSMLNKKSATRYFGVILVVLVGFFTLGLSLQSMQGDSLTMDELAHTTAAYSYIADMDYRLNPEHPPLIKLLAGGGVWLGSRLTSTTIVPPSQSQYWDGPNKQWDVGRDFFYTLGNDPKFLIFWSRLPMILVSFAGALYLFYAVLYHTQNVKVATLTGIGYLTSINILAHSRYVTTDVGISLALIAVIDWFSRYLKISSKKHIFGLIAALVIASLTKFSWILILPLMIVYLVWYRKAVNGYTWWSIIAEVVRSGVLFIMVWMVVVFCVYQPLITNIPLSLQEDLIIESFPSDNQISHIVRASLTGLANISGLRSFTHYLTGQMMVFQRVGGGNIVFLLGQVTDSSFRWYFPVTYLVKTSIPFLFLLGMTVLTFMYAFLKKIEIQKKIPLFYQILVVFIGWYWVIAISSNLNLGIRYILPIVVATEIVVWFVIFSLKPKIYLWSSIIYVGIIWVWLTPILAFPSYLGYVNDFVGKERAFQVFVDSNLDWGQDLYRLVDFTTKNNIDTIKLDYFGGGDPQLEFPGKFTKLDSREGPQSGWIAISATKLQSSRYYQQKFNLEDYWWLFWETPQEVIGGSILVYYIEPNIE